jgi:type VI secretion system protein ImpJ
MNGVRDVPDAVQWHEGMLLAPQHFQQFAVRTEAVLQYHLQTVAPFHWGVREFRIDPVSLPDGTFRVLQLEAVLPDGLLVTHKAGERDELSISLREAAAAAPNTTLIVHLVVPTRRADETSGNGAFARYASYEGAPVPDLNTGDGELAIPRLRPKPSLLIAETPPDRYVSIPLARVEYRDEAFVLTDYIPPLLVVAPQTDLGRTCSEITHRVREKAAYLADRARTTTAAERTTVLTETEKMAESLAAGLPPLEAMLRAGVAHPYTLFIQMCTFAGLASAAGRALVPPVFEAYDHSNLRATFTQVTKFVEELLAGIRENYRTVAFQNVGGVFELALQGAWVRGSNLLVGVVAPTGETAADCAAWFDKSLIASKKSMAALRERRIRGPARSRVAAPDALGIAPRRGEIVFSVEVDPQYVEAGETLQILQQVETGADRPREVVLYVANA